ncbi:hypothetical protein T492DRAFT_841095 [Pavlovales sp. CCMP2436]|nr:hypothetical protein T492DRAFT_841095 [Pavlovales sp. CCMP2436]
MADLDLSSWARAEDDLPSWSHDLAFIRAAGIVTDERLASDWAGKEVAYARYGGMGLAAMVLYYALMLQVVDRLPARARCRLAAVLLLLAADYSLSSGLWHSLLSALCLFVLCQHPDDGGSVRLLLCRDIRATVSLMNLHKACKHTAEEGSMRWKNWLALLCRPGRGCAAPKPRPCCSGIP